MLLNSAEAIKHVNGAMALALLAVRVHELFMALLGPNLCIAIVLINKQLIEDYPWWMNKSRCLETSSGSNDMVGN